DEVSDVGLARVDEEVRDHPPPDLLAGDRPVLDDLLDQRLAVAEVVLLGDVVSLPGSDADVAECDGGDASLGEELLGGQQEELTGRLALGVRPRPGGCRRTRRPRPAWSTFGR